MYFFVITALLVSSVWTTVSAGPAFINEEDDDLALKSEGIIDFFITDRNNINVTASVVALFSQLTLNLVLSGTAYSAVIPYECYFEDGQDRTKRILFVEDSCPMKTVSPLGNMERVNETMYRMPFKAFAFTPAPVARLAVYCQITLCIDLNVGDFCNKSCWKEPPGPRLFSQGLMESPVWERRPRQASGPLMKVVNLIVTDKNVSTPASAKTTPMPSTTTTMLYVMYGLSGFFAFLFFILLIGIIAFLCCSPKKEKRSRVVYATPPSNMMPSMSPPLNLAPPMPHQYVLPSQYVDPVFSNLPGQAPYCDWYTVFRIPRVWTDRNKPSLSVRGSSDGGGSSDSGRPSTSGSSQEAIMKKNRQKKTIYGVGQVEEPRVRGRPSGQIRYIVS